MDELIKKNLLALSQGLKDQRELINTQFEKIQSLETQVVQIQQQLISIQQQNAVYMAKAQGTGATVR